MILEAPKCECLPVPSGRSLKAKYTLPPPKVLPMWRWSRLIKGRISSFLQRRRLTVETRRSTWRTGVGNTQTSAQHGAPDRRRRTGVQEFLRQPARRDGHVAKTDDRQTAIVHRRRQPAGSGLDRTARVWVNNLSSRSCRAGTTHQRLADARLSRPRGLVRGDRTDDRVAPQGPAVARPAVPVGRGFPQG
jgi:hypothetical protein